ncbi:hypothetical protein FR483_n286R [Paramecium bursaria Chlorella virus FR483]|uniref:Uncharacterized protein n286R n=1 Tax=Paramecium bursaria Chlorella virus FR483 TaxID=399781 RepID=A7J6Z0_PBCVF|nr:hypothetical protein FR483_n286R [Paramecium bursaria Chlorella virus FR483]ABT15571.1 hypothetical protein FR483_n286R [Paramecium bursaria Chlorella virus FR483]
MIRHMMLAAHHTPLSNTERAFTWTSPPNHQNSLTSRHMVSPVRQMHRCLQPLMRPLVSMGATLACWRTSQRIR